MHETISTKQAAKALGISVATITRMVKRGHLHAYKLTPARNSPLRIYRSSVDALIQRRQPSATNQNRPAT